jgi:hypothetical protein
MALTTAMVCTKSTHAATFTVGNIYTATRVNGYTIEVACDMGIAHNVVPVWGAACTYSHTSAHNQYTFERV